MSKSPPKQKHRMRRPQPEGAKPGRRFFSIKDCYSENQLAEIGAIALTWNQVESAIDFLLLKAIDMPMGMWMPVVKRINGLDGKLEILRLRAGHNKVLSEEARGQIKFSLDGVAEYKKYRDSIVHSITWDVTRGIAYRIGSRAEVHEILVTIEALRALYERLVLLYEELISLQFLFRLDDKVAAAKAFPNAPDPLKARSEHVLPTETALIRTRQSRRRSLPPLPEFPEESLHPRDWMDQFAGPSKQVRINPALLPKSEDQK